MDIRWQGFEECEDEAVASYAHSEHERCASQHYMTISQGSIGRRLETKLKHDLDRLFSV